MDVHSTNLKDLSHEIFVCWNLYEIKFQFFLTTNAYFNFFSIIHIVWNFLLPYIDYSSQPASKDSQVVK